MLPVREHVLARHACLAVRAVLAAISLSAGRPPYVGALLGLLRRIHPGFGVLALVTLGRQRDQGFLRSVWADRAHFVHTCPGFARVACGLSSLPPVQDIDDDPLVVGDWCVSATLWGNPFLLASTGACLEAVHPVLAEHRGLLLVGDAVVAGMVAEVVLARFPSAAGADEGGRVWRDVVGGTCHVLCHPPLPGSVLWDFPTGPRLVVALAGCLPMPWRQAAASGVLARGGHGGPAGFPPVEHVEAALVRRLGWRMPDGSALPLLGLTVRWATSILVQPAVARRTLLHEAFCVAAYVGAAPPPGAPSLALTLRRLWKVRWENHYKEPFWRLSVDGFPMVGNSHLSRLAAAVCPCGAPASPSPRDHAFWDCPVARAVLESLEPQVPGVVLCKHHVWLALPPPGVLPAVWDVVCLAAVFSVDVGRKCLYSPVPAGGLFSVVDRASYKAVVTFWSCLASFAELQPVKGALARVPVSHPFLGCVGGVRLVVNRVPSGS